MATVFRLKRIDQIIDYLYYIEDAWQPLIDILPMLLVVLLDRLVRLLISLFMSYRK